MSNKEFTDCSGQQPEGYGEWTEKELKAYVLEKQPLDLVREAVLGQVKTQKHPKTFIERNRYCRETIDEMHIRKTKYHDRALTEDEEKGLPLIKAKWIQENKKLGEWIKGVVESLAVRKARDLGVTDNPENTTYLTEKFTHLCQAWAKNGSWANYVALNTSIQGQFAANKKFKKQLEAAYLFLHNTEYLPKPPNQLKKQFVFCIETQISIQLSYLRDRLNHAGEDPITGKPNKYVFRTTRTKEEREADGGSKSRRDPLVALGEAPEDMIERKLSRHKSKKQKEKKSRRLFREKEREEGALSNAIKQLTADERANDIDAAKAVLQLSKELKKATKNPTKLGKNNNGVPILPPLPPATTNQITNGENNEGVPELPPMPPAALLSPLPKTLPTKDVEVNTDIVHREATMNMQKGDGHNLVEMFATTENNKQVDAYRMDPTEQILYDIDDSSDDGNGTNMDPPPIQRNREDMDVMIGNHNGQSQLCNTNITSDNTQTKTVTTYEKYGGKFNSLVEATAVREQKRKEEKEKRELKRNSPPTPGSRTSPRFKRRSKRNTTPNSTATTPSRTAVNKIHKRNKTPRSTPRDQNKNSNAKSRKEHTNGQQQKSSEKANVLEEKNYCTHDGKPITDKALAAMKKKGYYYVECWHENEETGQWVYGPCKEWILRDVLAYDEERDYVWLHWVFGDQYWGKKSDYYNQDEYRPFIDRCIERQNKTGIVYDPEPEYNEFVNAQKKTKRKQKKLTWDQWKKQKDDEGDDTKSTRTAKRTHCTKKNTRKK